MNLVESTNTSARTTRRRPEGDSVSRWGSVPDSPRLGRVEEATLVRRARGGDDAAMERLIAANIRLIYKVARRYRCRSHTLEDLVQEGVVGMMCAVERFDESLGYRLCTYALHWIRQAITRAVEQNDRLIHVPMQATAELRRLLKLRDERHRELGRTPTEAELAHVSGMTEERVTQLLGSAEDALSLEALVGAEQETSLLDLTEDTDAVNPEHYALDGMHSQHLRRLVSDLRPREQQILEERFGLDGRPPRTLEELSQSLSISRERVRQIEARGIQKLRHALYASQWD